MTVIEHIAGALERRTSRRGFLVRTAVVGSALAVGPVDYLLHPGTAYAFVCRCGDAGCRCGSACCDGYTEFCCTLTGSNTCPPGTFAGGWWRADGSAFCGGGPRYYIDCHGECPTETGAGFCAGGDGLTCGCAFGSCGNRQVGCITFRYGQCHQEIPTAGRIACRVVTCTPAYLLDNACSNQALVDDLTAAHNRPCLQAPPVVRRAYSSAAAPGGGAWLVSPDGSVFPWGPAVVHGSLAGHPLPAPVVAIAATPDGNGYWLATADGSVFPFGSATPHGSMAGRHLTAPIVAMAATPDGRGYWLLGADGGVFAFGSASFYGSMGGTVLQQPIVGMAVAPGGDGYWMVASDGGVFAFGSASFHGSTGGQPLTAFIAGIVAAPNGAGYWLWGQDGEVHPFGAVADWSDYIHLPPGQRQLPNGVDAFYALVVGKDSYTLVAVSSLGPPPTLHAYQFPAASAGSG